MLLRLRKKHWDTVGNPLLPELLMMASMIRNDFSVLATVLGVCRRLRTATRFMVRHCFRP